MFPWICNHTPLLICNITLQVFDREGDDGKFVSVTVKAVDQGDPSLEGVCSFTVEITDINDNPPLFDRQVNNANLWKSRPKKKYRKLSN